jgi:hypothetical protein
MKDQHTSGVAAAAADLDFTAISTVHMRPLAAAIGYRYSAAGSTVLMRAAAAASVPLHIRGPPPAIGLTKTNGWISVGGCWN